MDAAERVLYFVKEKNTSPYEAWNNSSVLLVNASKVRTVENKLMLLLIIIVILFRLI